MAREAVPRLVMAQSPVKIARSERGGVVRAFGLVRLSHASALPWVIDGDVGRDAKASAQVERATVAHVWVEVV